MNTIKKFNFASNEYPMFFFICQKHLPDVLCSFNAFAEDDLLEKNPAYSE
jgi:hypothetical protein